MPTDRELVIDATTRVTWYVDRTRWGDITDLFTDKVKVDYTSLNGGEAATVAAADLVRSWQAGLGHLAATQHLLGTFLVDVDETARSAEATAHFVATHVGDDGIGSARWTLGGHYHWELREVEGSWRITAMTMTATWSDGDRGIMNPPADQP